MHKGKLLLLLILFSVYSCRKQQTDIALLGNETSAQGKHLDLLESRAQMNMDSAQWDNELFHQDIETYRDYNELLNSFPLNKSPFPVAQYDYAVSSTPFTIRLENAVFKGIQIG